MKVSATHKFLEGKRPYARNTLPKEGEDIGGKFSTEKAFIYNLNPDFYHSLEAMLAAPLFGVRELDENGSITANIQHFPHNPLNYYDMSAFSAVQFVADGQMWGKQEGQILADTCASMSKKLTGCPKRLAEAVRLLMSFHMPKKVLGKMSASQRHSFVNKSGRDWMKEYEDEVFFLSSLLMPVEYNQVDEKMQHLPTISAPFWYCEYESAASIVPVSKKIGIGNGSQDLSFEQQVMDEGWEERMIDFGSFQFEQPRLPFPSMILEFPPPPNAFLDGFDANICLWIRQMEISNICDGQEFHLHKITWLSDHPIHLRQGIAVDDDATPQQRLNQLNDVGAVSGMPMFFYNWDLWVREDGYVNFSHIKANAAHDPYSPAPYTVLYHLMIQQVSMIALKIISVLNCKNVELVDNRVSTKLNKSRKKKGKMPINVFKTLKIKSVSGKEVETKNSKATGETNRLHLCRGHYRRYSEEKPLFGKHSGLFWIQPHVRGDAGKGKVLKDYNLTEETKSENK